MKEKLDAIVASVEPIRSLLDSKSSMSSVGKFLLPIRSESLMRDYTFSNEPLECLLFALQNLTNGEQGIAQALIWLNKINEAYKNKAATTFVDDLAQVIRLDIMTQLNGMRLTHAWKSERETSKLLAESHSDHSAKEKLSRTQTLLTGLLGYHLGSGLELSQKTIDGYNKLLTHTDDPLVISFIKQRIMTLQAHGYLNPDEFNMSQQQFDALRSDTKKLKTFVNQACLNGKVPTRPQFEEELTKAVYQMAGLSVFAGPLAFIIIPVALVTTPVFKIVDRVNYSTDQHKNAAYYGILDEAHLWIKKHIKSEAEKLCPNHQAISDEVLALAERCSTQYKSIPQSNLSYKSKTISDNVLFKRVTLGEEKVKTLRCRLLEIDPDIEQLDLLIKKVQNLASIANQLAEYMHSYREQLTSNDGLYHPSGYKNSISLDGFPLSELPNFLRSYENERASLTTEACTLSRDITVRLNAIQKDMDETIATKKNQQQSKEEAIERLEAGIFKWMY